VEALAGHWRVESDATLDRARDEDGSILGLTLVQLWEENGFLLGTRAILFGRVAVTFYPKLDTALTLGFSFVAFDTADPVILVNKSHFMIRTEVTNLQVIHPVLTLGTDLLGREVLAFGGDRYANSREVVDNGEEGDDDINDADMFDAPCAFNLPKFV
jgi:hypothetical protein